MIRLEKPLRFICDKICDNCLIRFKCWTQRGTKQLSVEEFHKIAEKSKCNGCVGSEFYPGCAN